MHAPNPGNCNADETNVRLVSFSKGTWLGEDTSRLAISMGLAVPFTNLT